MNAIIRLNTKSGQIVETRSVKNTITETRDSLANLWAVGQRVDRAHNKENQSPTKSVELRPARR
jgi:hypothetical protein